MAVETRLMEPKFGGVREWWGRLEGDDRSESTLNFAPRDSRQREGSRSGAGTSTILRRREAMPTFPGAGSLAGGVATDHMLDREATVSRDGASLPGTGLGQAA